MVIDNQDFINSGWHRWQ